MHTFLRCFAATLFLGVLAQPLPAGNRAQSASSADLFPTPVTGESWLSHLHRSFGDTSMGKTGHLGPPPFEFAKDAGESRPAAVPVSPRLTMLRGADLYRLNCRGCHGQDGLGAPPEINSVIDPVRATSVTLIMARMSQRGMDISATAAEELAKQSRAALLERLHRGGESMPPFSHLSEAEIRALVAYLDQMAGVRTAGAQAVVAESPLRIGEHIVKSTCHVCHDATGADPTPQQLEDGAIPPLETLGTRVTEAGLIHKVTAGAAVVMGTPATLHRGRMPVFDYLSPVEAADVYLYLSEYPPSRSASDGAIALVQQSPDATPPSSGGVRSVSTAPRMPGSTTSSEGPELPAAMLIGVVIAFVMAVLLAGLGFTRRELKRLSATAERAAAAGKSSQVDQVAESVMAC